MNGLRKFARKVSFARLLCIAILIVLTGLRIADVEPLEELRVRTFDLFQRLRPRSAEAGPIVIVDIDERSLSRIGQWPWPRTRLAELVSTLARQNAAVIAFDVIFAEPDRLSPGVAVEGFRDIDEETRQKLLSLRSNDEVFAEALKNASAVLGESAVASAGTSENMAQPRGLASLGEDPKPFLLAFPGVLRNIGVLSSAAAGSGLLTIKTERDGIVRRVPMISLIQDTVVPSLTLETLRVASGSDTLIVKSDPTGIKSVGATGFEIPTDRNGQFWVHFGPHDPARFISAADVLEGSLPKGAFSQKIVLIGTSAVGLLDTKTTPVEAVMPGVEVHAQILENVLSGTALEQPGYAIGLEILAAFAIGIAAIVLVPMLRPLWMLLLGLACIVGLLSIAWYCFVQNRLLFDFTYPLLAALLLYATLLFASFAREQSQKRQIRSAFGRYMSPELVEQLSSSPEKLVLGGEERDVTIMFSDVRGFSGIAEMYRHDPRGLTALMNRFLTPLSHAILENRGTIDKYIGDAIMAFWNAPLEDRAHQINACKAALEMLARIEALNDTREMDVPEGGLARPVLNIGIGLNTGNCIVGNMGSDMRFDYSVLGDAVNLASRLEGQSKVYGFPIVMGAATAQATMNDFAVIELDTIAVKGRSTPEMIYALAGNEELAKSPDFQRMRELVAEMLKRYRHGEWSTVFNILQEGRARNHDPRFAILFDLYESRTIERSKSNAIWSGVHVLTEK